MFNRSNRKNNIYSRNKSIRSTTDKWIDTQVVSQFGETKDHLLLLDKHGIVVSFPKTLVYANSLKIEKDNINLSQSIYDAWFKPKLTLEINEQSEKIFKNFDLLIKNSNIILSDTEFRNLHLPFLKSTILYSGSIIYPLGKVLESWMYEDDLKISQTDFMLKINISPLSGFNNYNAYSVEKKSIVSGSLGIQDKHWKSFLDEFYCFAPFKRNNSDLLVLTRLLFALGID